MIADTANPAADLEQTTTAALDAGGSSVSNEGDGADLSDSPGLGRAIGSNDADDAGGDDVDPAAEFNPAPGETEREPARDASGKFTSPEKLAADQEAIDRAAFEKVTGKAPPAPTTKAGDAAAATAQGDGKAKDGQAAAAPIKQGDADLSKLSADERYEIVQARRALARAQWEKSEIEALSPEKLLAKAKKLSPFLAEAEDNRAFRLANDPTKGRSTAGNQQSPTNGTANVRDGARSATATNAGELDDIDQLLDSLADEATAPKSGHGLDDPKVKEQLQRAAVRTREAEMSAARARITAAESKLSSEFPMAKTATPQQQQKFVELLDRADPKREVMLRGSEEQIETLLRDAAWAVFGPQIKHERHQDVLSRNRAQLAGQPLPPDGRNRAARTPRTQEEIDREHFDRIVNGAPARPAGAGSFAR